MATSNDFREYENGIADILSSVVGERAAVRRNVKLPASTGGRRRQIDILVEGSLFDLTEARMIVDCKRWKKRIDVADVEAFLGMVEDVKADAGMLVSSSGASTGAIDRAHAVRGIRLKAVSLAELRSWQPQGTVVATIELDRDALAIAAKVLRELGLRVLPRSDEDASSVTIEVFRHHGTSNPSGDLQQTQHLAAQQALDRLGMRYRRVGNGVVIGGGTPGHRWLPVTSNGADTGLKVLAATEADIERELNRLPPAGGLAREHLDVVRPSGWPFGNAFTL